MHKRILEAGRLATAARVVLFASEHSLPAGNRAGTFPAVARAPPAISTAGLACSFRMPAALRGVGVLTC